ncbi:MAG: sodium:proton antiporter [Deltaproteobacteria bacterium]|nr:sodium:proton antiporter [Deltaproteobacteria bacterium]MBW2594700.1 sodium:proton antiporter [Deltaproteobacteria bacterium]MBW2649525.1 sodium:proton antiporter [Deltaproteobacteria bacterium]
MEKSRECLLNILTFTLIYALSGLVFADFAVAAEAAVHSHGAHNIGTELPVWTAVPFVGILLSIALCPLLIPHFWHNHFGKISAFWALLFAVPFLFTYHNIALHHILHIYLIDYIPFIILLWGLFTIAGGIVVSGSLKGTPAVNTVMLLIGTILASCVGTTGAAMVMIRPVLRANRDRLKKTHIVCFFIFLVANIGGSLTPLGDPPLFLGFLHNVPFFWVTTNLLPHMLTASAILLVMFFIVDTFYYRREKDHVESGPEEEKTPLKIEGVVNFVFLLGVIGLVLMSGYWKPGHLSVVGVHLEYQSIVRDFGIITMGVLSLVVTSRRLREANDFSWFPIAEVAKLFAGIFMTIIPALAILKAGNDGALSGLVLAVKESYHYFWVTGILSSFLDNAPTYLTFFNLALGKLGITEAMVPGALAAKAVTANPEFIMYLKAISVGAVFMGANTYIGNAPNFMVKSIAEESGVTMPSFFGYMIKYSIPILAPVFLIITFIFF